MVEQKRVHMRLEDLVEVEFVSEAAGITTIIKTKTRDISAGGLKVYLSHGIRPKERMQLKITLPDNKKLIKLEGEIVSSELIGLIGDSGEQRLYETRFKFVNVEPELKNEIIRYVYDCRKRQYDARKNKE